MPANTPTRRPFFGLLWRRRSRGIALFEVILALGIVGAIIAGAVLLIQTAQAHARLNDTLAMINGIRAQVQAVFGGQADYTRLDAPWLHRRGKMPGAALSGAGTSAGHFQHPYGGQVTIDGFTGRRFLISLANIDDQDCEDILEPYVGKTRSTSGLITVGISTNTNSSTANPPTSRVASSLAAKGYGVGATTALPMPTTGPDAVCNEGAGRNEITFWFSG